ncbi:MAG: PEP/pyruvate-binding domain-containing protein [Thermoanaerobaculia bacterium]
MKKVTDQDVLDGVRSFDRTFFDPSARLKVIGSGSLGGKAQGLAFARMVLDSSFPHGRFPRIEVGIPSMTVLRTGVFDAFVERNGLGKFRDITTESSSETATSRLTPPFIGMRDEPESAERSDEEIARAFQRGDMPVEVLGDLRALVEQVKTPLAIRSSSLLEDALGEPFAGVYQTKMIPNNQPSPDDRFRPLVDAIKLVWASTFFSGARRYRAAAADIREEKMAVIIQEVVGDRYDQRFYPYVSGVARSINYYPTGRARPEDGVANLALGLGKTIVDGSVCWTYSPAFPAAAPPVGSPLELVKTTQTSFWAVNMGKPPAYDPIHETEFLVQPGLDDAENDGSLDWVASTFDAAAGRITPGIGRSGPRVLDFAMILALREQPLNDIVRELLTLFEKSLEAPVEIEFAMSLEPARFGFLQVRPMMVSSAIVEIDEDDLFGPDVLVASERVLGNGEIETIRDVVYVRPDRFDAKETPRIALELEQIDRVVSRTGGPYLLIGFGRWGSSDPWLGIPVSWPQIAGARAIVEAMTTRMNVDASQGSHFFHNLTSFGVSYFSISARGPYAIDWEWLERQTAGEETELVRHVRLDAPLTVKVDGRTGRGVIMKGGRR